MFDNYDSDVEERSVQSVAKKTKLHVERLEKKSKVVHSSLGYHSIKVPPIVEYKSVDNYCENKTGPFAAVPVMNIRKVSSPLVLRSPKSCSEVLPTVTRTHPYCFFSVEELSLVTDLQNWTNKKVCPVGKLSYTSEFHECFLNSSGEKGSWKISLNLSQLARNPDSHKLVQVFGNLCVANGQPKVSVFFLRNLESVDVPLFVESYKLMQTFVPRCLPALERDKVKELDSSWVDSDDACSDVGMG